MSRQSIALVEDNADIRFMLEFILSSRYDVMLFETGSETLTGLAARRPDLVLLDISLPDIDGTEVLRQIRADAALRSLPVVAFTAHALDGDRERYLASGFDGYLTKPVLDEAVLFDAITVLLPRTP